MTWTIDPDFAAVVLGDRSGVLCVSVGREPHRDDKDRYQHKVWREHLLDWPADREELERRVDEVLESGDPVDLYVCGAVRHKGAKGRRKGDAIPPTVLWADLDGEPKDAELYGRLVATGSLIVSSGSDGHRHLYLPLSRPVDLATFDKLNEALANKLGADAKWADNTVLRMPGTLNWKATVPAKGDEPGPATDVVVESYTPGTHDPDELILALGVVVTGPSATSGTLSSDTPKPSGEIEAEPVPDPLPKFVRLVLDNSDTEDRSLAIARLVSACLDSHLTVGQCLTICEGYAPAVEKHKTADRLVKDVERLWLKFTKDRAEHSEDFEYRSEGGPVTDSTDDPGTEDFEYRFRAGEIPPIPLPGRTSPLPLPESCPSLAEFVTEVADALQVPTDMPLTMALAVLAAATGGRWEAQVRPGWLEPLSIAVLVCAGSGERKSPVLAEVERPVKEFQAEARQLAMPGYRTRETKAALAKKRYETAMGKAGKSDDLEAEHEAIRLYEAWQTAQESLTPPPAWLIGADGTAESFVDQLVKHRSLGIVSSEPGLFGVLAGRYSSGAPNIEWFLAATSGERLDPHRIGRETGSVERPVLSALSCIQPGRLQELGKVKAFRDSGLLARHLFSISDTMLGRRLRPRQVSTQVRVQWASRVNDLLKASNKINLASTNSPQIKVVRCTDEAAELLVQFDDELEPELVPHTGRYCDIGDWIAKSVGMAARIACVLALMNDPAAELIEAAEVRDAVAIMRAYISHTMAAFALTDPASDLFGHANEVLTVARTVCRDGEFTRRDVHQKIRRRTWAQTAEALEGPLSVLTSHGFIVKPESPGEKSGPGRPPERYLLNPAEPVARESAARPRTPRNASSESSEPRLRPVSSLPRTPRNASSESSELESA